MNATGEVADAVAITHPPEPVVKMSMLLVIAGFALLASVILLSFFAWATQGKKDGKADIFGQYVTVREVAERYKAVWSPGQFWPRNAFTHTKKRDKGSPLFKVVWTFFIGWFICAAAYLIFAGAVEAIEVFREEAHLRAALCVSAAFSLCAVWPVLFRIGSTTNNMATGISGSSMTEGEKGDEVPIDNATTHSKTKEVFLWVACAILLIAAIFAVTGSALLQAWTLPGPQYGTLIFLGPGYGLFAGWLLFAAALNLSTAISYNSYPSGTLRWPETKTEYTHRDSLWPPVLALVISTIAVLILDPAIPLPMLVAIFLFTPRQWTHIAASLVCAVGIGVATLLVFLERAE